MMANQSFPENGVLLAVDVGAVHTRALLFDIVDGGYRLLGTGAARTPVNSGSDGLDPGVLQAVRELQKNTGRVLLDDQDKLIVPATAWNSGLDLVVGTVSLGQPLKILLVGLLEAVSMESLKHLAQALYPGDIQEISLDGLPEPQEQVETFLNFRPDLVLLAGGMDYGAERPILGSLDCIARAFTRLPASERPGIVYAGNSALQETFKESLPNEAELRFASNLRPSLEIESLEDALEKAADLLGQMRARQLFSDSAFIVDAGMSWLPTAAAFGQVVRFLSLVQRSNKGVLGVDIGASSATLAAAYAGQLRLGTYPKVGLCQGLAGLLDEVPLDLLNQWVSVPLPEALIPARSWRLSMPWLN